MRRGRLLWRVYRPHLLITSVGLLVVCLWVGRLFQDAYLDQVARDLTSRAQLFAAAAELPAVSGITGRLPLLEQAAQDLGQRTNTRFTVIERSGVVLAESNHEPGTMENHATRPEVIEALAGRTGRSQRYSATLGCDMMYLAVPTQLAGRDVIVRAALPVTSVWQRLRLIDQLFLWGALAIAALNALATLVSLRHVTRAVDTLRAGAERLAAGDLASQVPVPEASELAGLADALNNMAAQLSERLATVIRQRNEQDAVLSSMVEGVLAIDGRSVVISFNRAAGELFGGDPDRAVGRLIHEVVRNRDVHRFAERAMLGDSPVEGELVVFDGDERYLQANGTRLFDGAGRQIGAVLVFNDVTRIRRLENVRREFVANVSHELRTPITSIKGFIETLGAGAIDEPEDARRFLAIIARQADRLGAIIEDLLSLSRLDQSAEAQPIDLSEGSLAEVVKAAACVCAVKAAEKGVRLELPGPDELRAPINAALLEEAVVNLLDNAITYSEPGQTINVRLERDPGSAAIVVEDHGCGIPAEHLPRLFERFYRVDKARSRKQGGTGLGLAIVKHIASAHGGHVTVDSTPGRGSTFSLYVPLAAMPVVQAG